MQYVLSQEEYDTLANKKTDNTLVMKAQAEFVRRLIQNHQMLPGGMIGIYQSDLQAASERFEEVMKGGS